LLELVPLGHVVAGHDEAHEVLVDDVRDDRVDVGGVTVFADEPDLAARRATALRTADEVAGRLSVGVGDDLEPVHAEQLGCRQPDDRLDCGCDVHDRQVVIEDADHVGRVLQHQPEASLAATFEHDLADVEALQGQRHRLRERLERGDGAR
jgi:hypothetical protein